MSSGDDNSTRICYSGNTGALSINNKGAIAFDSAYVDGTVTEGSRGSTGQIITSRGDNFSPQWNNPVLPSTTVFTAQAMPLINSYITWGIGQKTDLFGGVNLGNVSNTDITITTAGFYVGTLNLNSSTDTTKYHVTVSNNNDQIYKNGAEYLNSSNSTFCFIAVASDVIRIAISPEITITNSDFLILQYVKFI